MTYIFMYPTGLHV